MPELPEVETIVRGLNQKIKGKIIKSVAVKAPKLVKLPISEFIREVRGQKVGPISRRAKVILIELGQEKVLLIHLKLTGQLIYREREGKITAGGHPVPHGLENLPNKFTHIIFTFTDGNHLFFNDLRKFGWLNVVPKTDLGRMIDQEFGVEPLSRDFTLKKFSEILKKGAAQPLKKALLDQKNIAGIGNIYADEACFYAGVKPIRKIGDLKPNEIKKLWQGIKSVLSDAILHRGSSVENFVDANGNQGSHTSFLKVYNRKGKRCKRRGCGGEVAKIKFGGRGTHYCDKCQR